MRKAALFGVIPPFLLKTEDNPEGVDGQVFEDIKAAIVKDRYAYFGLPRQLLQRRRPAPERISDPAWQASFEVAAGSSPYASYACVDTWLTDFREDLPKIDVPTLVMHGTQDRILPFEATAGRRARTHRGRNGRGRRRPPQHRVDVPRRGQRGAA